MSFILKVMHNPDSSPVESDNPHSVYADIVSVHFSRPTNGEAEAKYYVREPVKTGVIAGVVEVMQTVVFDTVAYVMNEDGKTVSRFTAKTSRETPLHAISDGLAAR